MRTTKADFQLFQRSCEKYLSTLGMAEWSVFYDHTDCGDTYAQTHWKLSGGVATIVLNTQWDELRPKSDVEIERLALHEVLHILLAPLIAEAEDRWANQDAIEIAEHAIVRKLEKLVKGVET